MIVTNNTTNVKSNALVEVHYEEKTGLFGLLKWREVVKEKEIGKALFIETQTPVEDIFVNGRRVTYKK